MLSFSDKNLKHTRGGGREAKREIKHWARPKEKTGGKRVSVLSELTLNTTGCRCRAHARNFHYTSKMHTKRPRNEFTSKTARNTSIGLPVDSNERLALSRLLSTSSQEIPRVARRRGSSRESIAISISQSRDYVSRATVFDSSMLSSAGVAYYSLDRQPGIEISA